MQSKACCYHKGLGRNLFLRCWPIWIGWLALLMMIFPLALNDSFHAWMGNDDYLRNYIITSVLDSGCLAAKVAAFAAIITVMAMFSYLYNARTCGLINAFPVRRETVFFTAFFTGLLPLLIAELITALSAWMLLRNWIPLNLVGRWFVLAGLGTVAFYGFSVFCAMLTGSLFILPLVYAVLNVTATVAEESIHELLKIFLYGYAESGNSFQWLSPLVTVLRLNAVDQVGTGIVSPQNQPINSIYIPDENVLLYYCIAGIVLSVVSLILYRHRRMESAGDTVAIPILKPVFKYCMAFGTALVLSAFITGEFFGESFRSSGRALVALILLLGGAFIGYFSAEMLIQKTMNVFHSRWKGLLAVWSILAVFVIACEFDITGYEKAIPQNAEVEKVNFGVYTSSAVKERENIDAVLALHESILQSREEQINTVDRRQLNLRYTLKNGKDLVRCYSLNADEAHRSDETSAVWKVQKLLNTPEAIQSRKGTAVSILPETIENCTIYCQKLIDADRMLYGESKEVQLSPEEAFALYTEAILPDMEEGLIGREYFFDEAWMPTRSDTSISIDLSEGEVTRADGTKYYHSFYYVYYNVEMDSARTIAWLKDHLDLEVKPFAEEIEPVLPASPVYAMK